MNFGKKLSFAERIKMRLKGEKRRKFEYEYSFSKVRKRQGKFSNIQFVRFAKNALGRLGIRESQVIKFPKNYKEPTLLVDTQIPQEPQKLNPYSENIIEKVFISIMIELAHLPENIEWYVGVRKEPFIKDEFKKQLERMKEIEVLGGFYNLHEQIETTLAMMISYYYPELVQKYGVNISKTLKSAKLEKYPSAKDIELFTDEDIKKLKSDKPKEDKKHEGIVIFEMSDKIANHYGFSKPASIRCNIDFVKYIFSCNDNEIVIFELEGKKVEITAKMFRRIFHRGTTPLKEETNNVIELK